MTTVSPCGIKQSVPVTQYIAFEVGTECFDTCYLKFVLQSVNMFYSSEYMIMW